MEQIERGKMEMREGEREKRLKTHWNKNAQRQSISIRIVESMIAFCCPTFVVVVVDISTAAEDCAINPK